MEETVVKVRRINCDCGKIHQLPWGNSVKCGCGKTYLVTPKGRQFVVIPGGQR